MPVPVADRVPTLQTVQRLWASLCHVITNWTQLGDAGDPDSPRHAAALAAVLERYRPAMIEFLVRYRGFRSGDAEDIVQEFIVRRILAGQFLAKADRGRGRFRDLLRVSLGRFAESERRRQGRDVMMPELPDVPGPEESRVFNAEFARQVIELALERMRAEAERTRKQHIWLYFWHRVARPLLEGRKPPTLDELRERMAPHELGDPDNAHRTAKNMYTRTMRQVVSEYPINDPDAEIDDLLHWLQPRSGRGGPPRDRPGRNGGGAAPAAGQPEPQS